MKYLFSAVLGIALAVVPVVTVQAESNGPPRRPIQRIVVNLARDTFAVDATVTASSEPGPNPRFEQTTGLLGEADLAELLVHTAVPVEWRSSLTAIIRCESGHTDTGGHWWVDPWAIGDGGRARGLTQIHWYATRVWDGWALPAIRAGAIGPNDLDRWQVPAVNIRAALWIRATNGRWGGAGGWTCADRLGIW